MFTVTRKGANRIDIEYSGKLDNEEMKAALDELVRKTQDVENGRMLFRVGDFKLPTLAAVGIEFSRLPAMFGLIRQFERCAVIADQTWVKVISEIEGALIPGVEIKGSNPDQEAEAGAWLAAD